METPINLLKIELESNQKQCEYYKGVDNNLAIQYKKRVVEIKKAIDILERAKAEPSDDNAVLPIHGVVGQSEQLLAFAQYLHNHSYVNKGFKPETLVRRFKGE